MAPSPETPCVCGHPLSDHARGQWRTRWFCEAPNCECDDFKEKTMSRIKRLSENAGTRAAWSYDTADPKTQPLFVKITEMANIIQAKSGRSPYEMFMSQAMFDLICEEGGDYRAYNITVTAEVGVGHIVLVAGEDTPAECGVIVTDEVIALVRQAWAGGREEGKHAVSRALSDALKPEGPAYHGAVSGDYDAFRQEGGPHRFHGG